MDDRKSKLAKRLPQSSGKALAVKNGKQQTPARPKAKVKTGCRTCKLRKVKCDEGRPACSRCVSTGRTCEGYGIWGGGNKGAPADSVSAVTPAALMMAMGRRQRQAAQSPPWQSIPPQLLNGTVAPLSSQGCNWLDWFRWRTAVKLRGAFSMAFWDVLVIRASLEEPAVLHAALALSTVHRRVGGGEGMGITSNERLAVAESCSEEFTLRQYNKAIHHLMSSPTTRDALGPSGASHDIASTRIMLVACMLFTCLEFMRGRFQTGSTHLQNGVRLLDNLYARQRERSSPSSPALNSFRLVRDKNYPADNLDSIDQWLLEAFARMNLLAAQFGHGYAGSMLPTAPQYFFSPDHHLLTLPITFVSVSQARNSLDQLVYEVFTLTGQSQDLHNRRREVASSHLLLNDGDSTSSSSVSSPSSLTGGETKSALSREQARLVAALDAWHATYRASRISLYARPDVDLLARVAYQMLVLYYDMASILVATCLSPDPELAFDAHVGRFLTILRNALLFIRAVKDVHNSQDVHFRIDPDIAEQLGSAASPVVCLFNADVGWTPPLYFTALHCRVPRIRKQAVRFVKSIPSREGLWDSQLASAVAEEVIRLETSEAQSVPEEPAQSSLFLSLDNELFELDQPPPPLTTLPASEPRIHNFHVVLPDSWSGPTIMTCEKRWFDGRCEAIKTVYDPATKQWTRK